MKRLIAICMLTVFLGSATELHELLKLPHLLVHFIEHTQTSGLSLSEYLHIHYAHDHENHKDEHHDKGCLPFQGDHASLVLGNGGLYFHGTAIPDIVASRTSACVRWQ